MHGWQGRGLGAFLVHSALGQHQPASDCSGADQVQGRAAEAAIEGPADYLAVHGNLFGASGWAEKAA